LAHPGRSAAEVVRRGHWRDQQRGAFNGLAPFENQLRLFRGQTNRKRKAIIKSLESRAPAAAPLQTEIDATIGTADNPVWIDSFRDDIGAMQPATETNLTGGRQCFLDAVVLERFPPARPLRLSGDVPIGRPRGKRIDDLRFLAAISQPDMHAKELPSIRELNDPGNENLV